MVELSVVEVALRIGVAAVLGAIVGAEREIDGQDAGLRTISCWPRGRRFSG